MRRALFYVGAATLALVLGTSAALTAAKVWPSCGPHRLVREGGYLKMTVAMGTWPACRSLGPYYLPDR